MKYLKTFESNAKYSKMTEEKFFNILENNCKNFSVNDDALYRGEFETFEDDKFVLHNPIERNTMAITYTSFFDEKAKDRDKYPVVRKESAMGIGGGARKDMIRAASMLGDYDGGPVFRVIPFDDSKIVFCPAFDLALLDMFHDIDEVTDDDFIMVEYTKNFKVPVEELKEIQQKIIGKDMTDKGFEFFMSSPALLINIENEDLLK